MKKILRVALPLIVLLILGGTALVCWLSPKKPVLAGAVACPPVRTSLAMIALAENPTARTYAAVGAGAGAFTNVFAHAGLVAVTNAAARVDLVFVSGEVSRDALARAWARCATNGLLAVHYDVRKLPFPLFRERLRVLPRDAWRLWFPGRSDALVTVPVDAASRPRLSDMLDLFAREGLFTDLAHAGIDSLPVLIANYVGPNESVMPVFGFAQGEVVPECFVTKEIPDMDWIDRTGVDADIREPLFSEIRSMQVIRRVVLQGDIHARDRKMDAAMDAWTKAIKRNPNDTLILERICQLDVNAETFFKVGNFPMAAQCLETMVCLRPKDAQIARRLARVLQQLGKKEMADAVNKRADELVKGTLAVRLSSPVSRPSSGPVSRLPSHDLKPSTLTESVK